MNIVQLILSLSILVFIHELGHFLFARLFGTRVEKFYLFFNPWFSLFKWRSPRSGTVYGLGWLPLGGYCQIAGMVDENMDTESLKSEPKPDEFRSKKAWQRLLIMAGGIIFNLVLAAIIYIGIALYWGQAHLAPKDVQAGYQFSALAHSVGFEDGDRILRVDGNQELNALDKGFLYSLVQAQSVVVLRGSDTLHIVLPSDLMPRIIESEEPFASMRLPFVIEAIQRSSTESAGLRSGDRVLSVEGTQTPDLSSTVQALAQHAGKVVRLEVLSEGANQSSTYSVEVDSDGRIGVQLRSPERIYPISQIRYSVLEAIPAGLSQAYDTLTSYASSLKLLFTKQGAKSVGGLGTMAQLFPKTFSWQGFWSITAFLSIMLAVMNLLPIPALDGGHIVFLLVEMTTGRKLSDKAMGYVQMAGMIFLLALMVLANGNDIYRFLIK